MIIIILFSIANIVKMELPIGYTVYRGQFDVFAIRNGNNNKMNSDQCLIPKYWSSTFASIINYEDPKCVSFNDISKIPDLKDVLYANKRLGNKLFVTGSSNVFGLWQQNREPYQCPMKKDLQLEKIEIFDYNRWMSLPLNYMSIKRTTFRGPYQKLIIILKNYDATGGLYRLYINCGGRKNSFFKKYDGYHYYTYPWSSFDVHQNNVTRHQDGDIFAKGASVNKCGDFNADFHSTTECKCKENGTLLYDQHAQRCFVDEEIEHNLQKDSLLHLPQNSENNTNTNEPQEGAIWYNRTSHVLTANFVDANGEIPVCRGMKNVTCQMYGNRQMTKCPSHKQIVQLRNASVYFMLLAKDFKTFTGQVALFTFECYQGNDKTTKQYKFLMKFDGSSTSLHKEPVKPLRKYNHTWWIICVVLVLVCVGGMFVVKSYLQKLREKKAAWKEMEFMIKRNVTPKDTGGIYMQVFDRTNEPIYQKIPQHPSETSSPFPRAGPLAYKNFLYLDT